MADHLSQQPVKPSTDWAEEDGTDISVTASAEPLVAQSAALADLNAAAAATPIRPRTGRIRPSATSDHSSPPMHSSPDSPPLPPSPTVLPSTEQLQVEPVPSGGEVETEFDPSSHPTAALPLQRIPSDSQVPAAVVSARRSHVRALSVPLSPLGADGPSSPATALAARLAAIAASKMSSPKGHSRSPSFGTNGPMSPSHRIKHGSIQWEDQPLSELSLSATPPPLDSSSLLGVRIGSDGTFYFPPAPPGETESERRLRLMRIEHADLAYLLRVSKGALFENEHVKRKASNVAELHMVELGGRRRTTVAEQAAKNRLAKLLSDQAAAMSHKQEQQQENGATEADETASPVEEPEPAEDALDTVVDDEADPSAEDTASAASDASDATRTRKSAKRLRFLAHKADRATRLRDLLERAEQRRVDGGDEESAVAAADRKLLRRLSARKAEEEAEEAAADGDEEEEETEEEKAAMEESIREAKRIAREEAERDAAAAAAEAAETTSSPPNQDESGLAESPDVPSIDDDASSEKRTPTASKRVVKRKKHATLRGEADSPTPGMPRAALRRQGSTRRASLTAEEAKPLPSLVIAPDSPASLSHMRSPGKSILRTVPGHAMPARSPHGRPVHFATDADGLDEEGLPRVRVYVFDETKPPPSLPQRSFAPVAEPVEEITTDSAPTIAPVEEPAESQSSAPPTLPPVLDLPSASVPTDEPLSSFTDAAIEAAAVASAAAESNQLRPVVLNDLLYSDDPTPRPDHDTINSVPDETGSMSLAPIEPAEAIPHPSGATDVASAVEEENTDSQPIEPAEPLLDPPQTSYAVTIDDLPSGRSDFNPTVTVEDEPEPALFDSPRSSVREDETVAEDLPLPQLPRIDSVSSPARSHANDDWDSYESSRVAGVLGHALSLRGAAGRVAAKYLTPVRDGASGASEEDDEMYLSPPRVLASGSSARRPKPGTMAFFRRTPSNRPRPIEKQSERDTANRPPRLGFGSNTRQRLRPTDLNRGDAFENDALSLRSSLSPAGRSARRAYERAATRPNNTTEASPERPSARGTAAASTSTPSPTRARTSESSTRPPWNETTGSARPSTAPGVPGRLPVSLKPKSAALQGRVQRLRDHTSASALPAAALHAAGNNLLHTQAQGIESTRRMVRQLVSRKHPPGGVGLASSASDGSLAGLARLMAAGVLPPNAVVRHPVELVHPDKLRAVFDAPTVQPPTPYRERNLFEHGGGETAATTTSGTNEHVDSSAHSAPADGADTASAVAGSAAINGTPRSLAPVRVCPGSGGRVRQPAPMSVAGLPPPARVLEAAAFLFDEFADPTPSSRALVASASAPHILHAPFGVAKLPPHLQARRREQDAQDVELLSRALHRNQVARRRADHLQQAAARTSIDPRAARAGSSPVGAGVGVVGPNSFVDGSRGTWLERMQLEAEMVARERAAFAHAASEARIMHTTTNTSRLLHLQDDQTPSEADDTASLAPPPSEEKESPAHSRASPSRAMSTPSISLRPVAHSHGHAYASPIPLVRQWKSPVAVPARLAKLTDSNA